MLPQLHSPTGGADPRLRRLFGEKTGLVRSVFSSRLDARDDPDVFITQTEETIETSGGSVTIEGSGQGQTLDQGIVTAVGETVERYCQYLPRRRETEQHTYTELMDEDERVIDFEYLAPYSQSQYEGTNLVMPHRDTELSWYQGTDLVTGERTYIPSQYIWPAGETASEAYFPTTSNGAACGETLEMALLGGIYEAIERDGFMRAWCCQTSPDRFDPREGPQFVEFVDEFASQTMQFHLLDYDTAHDLPTFGCVVTNEHNQVPKFLITGSASYSSRVAARDALLEGAQALTGIKLNIFEQGEVGRDTVSFKQAAVHYAYPERFEEVSFLTRGDRVPFPETGRHQPDDDRTELLAVLERLEAAGLHPVAIDITRDDIAEVGWRVVKVFIPQLLSLSPANILPDEHPALADCSVTDKMHPYP